VVDRVIGLLRGLIEAATCPAPHVETTRQMAFRIMRLCIPTQITHLLRSTPPRATQAAAARLDEELIKGFVELMGTKLPPEGTTWCDIVRQRILLPISLGGMGLTQSTGATAPAFLGSLALTCKRIVALIPDMEPHLHNSLTAWGYDALVDRLGILDQNAVMPAKEALHQESVPKLQGKLTEMVTRAIWKGLYDRLPYVAEGAAGYDPVLAALREAFGHCSKEDKTCNAWITANPASKRNRLTDMEFLRGCQIRLVLPVRELGRHGQQCGKKNCSQRLFEFVHHELNCEVTKGGRTTRHSSKTTRPLYYYLSTTRAFVPSPKHEPLCRESLVPKPGVEPEDPPDIQPPVGRNIRPPGFRADFSVTMAEVEYLVDFTVHSVPLGKFRDIGTKEQREHDAKLTKYSARYLPSNTAKVVPLSCSTYGSMAKKGTLFLEGLAKHIADVKCAQTIDKLRGRPEATRMEYSKQLRTLSEIICIGILRGNASMISTYASYYHMRAQARIGDAAPAPGAIQRAAATPI
jgi:hypothetical protein